MEHQFILRVDEELKEILQTNSKNIELEVTGEDTITLRHNSIEYSGSISKLPCIIESHKTMDNQQFYKISDISHIVVIGNKNKGEHGITPPMYNAKHRFRKRVVKTQMVEEIENRVKELLERDKNCVGVELIFGEGEQKEESEDVSSLAAELEYNLIANEKNIVTEENNEIKQKKELLKELEEKIKTKEELLNTASNIILKKRFHESIVALKEEYNKIIEEIKELENNEKE